MVCSGCHFPGKLSQIQLTITIQDLRIKVSRSLNDISVVTQPGSHSIKVFDKTDLRLLYGNSKINPRSTAKHWDEIKHKSQTWWDLNKVFVHFIRHYSPLVLELSVPHIDPEENWFHATSTHASTCVKMFYDTIRHARETSRQRKVRMMDKSMLSTALLREKESNKCVCTG